MSKLNLFAAITAAATLVSGAAMATAAVEKEKCEGLNIKAGKADCKGATHSCAGQNKEGDKESWIYVNKGDCAKIKDGTMKDDRLVETK